MESNVEEALRFKANAEKKFAERNFVGARNYALKAQKFCPELEGISQMVATFGVYIASEAKINGEFDFYSILGMDPFADKSKLKKQYKKMTLLLHPDKNKTVGADGAFRLVSEAWTHLSNSVKRISYDHRRTLYAGHASGAGGYDIYSKAAVSHSRLNTFWTVCTTCGVQYEYLRKYVNKRLSCKNCRGIFIAVETGVAPINGSFSYGPSSYVSENGYGSHVRGGAYIPTTTGYCAPNGVSGHHTGRGAEYVSNLSFQSNSFPGYSVDVLDPNESSTSSFTFYQANKKANKTKANGNHHMVKAAVDIVSIPCTDYNGISRPKRGRPAKKIKVDLTSSHANGHEELSTETVIKAKMTSGNGNLKHNSKLYSPSETSIRRSSAAPPFDARQLLIDKARSEIRNKLEEMRLASEAAVAEAVKRKTQDEVDKSGEAVKISGTTGTGNHADLKRTFSMSITVPDSDFHDFDKDRSEDCFKPKQIWALYDEEDGMPRLYCLIREVISVSPFKIHIGYLSSKTDNEFGSVNWLDFGFTKSCGNFRVYHSEIVEQVNIFSHLLGREKAGRGGCVRIYPRSGDIWAVYRNWSPNWNRATPDTLKHQYEMVEVLDNYSEELGVCVAPLIKLVGFKTVYQRNTNKDVIQWIPRKEMLRFSHQVPSSLLKSVDTKLPEGCWDLDPAATPGDLEEESEAQNNAIPCRVQNSSKTLDQQCHSGTIEWEEKFSQTNNFSTSPDDWSPVVSKPCTEERISVELPQAENLIKTPVELPQTETRVKT
ncbi:unnamed protein product [Fraxinus pennsylvanica]|uniref:J domain-containing protein n=1 Tax=Fraxinus pennsylvanica TaxID=56036 RepID=A0AAD1ZMN7_9LAMI|nr:unnamed protein product [Fraxinus pennsylvanica]